MFGKIFTRCEQSSTTAFAEEGFSNWKKTLDRFKLHENSAVHKMCVQKYGLYASGKTVYAEISKQKGNEMLQSRFALKCIISTLQYIATQGQAIRGHTDENSNFMTLMRLRSMDILDVELWLKRSKYKWCSHDILNEILTIMSFNIQTELINLIKEAKYYAIMLDETADISSREQISIGFRIVKADFEIHEYFLGFYNTNVT